MYTPEKNFKQFDKQFGLVILFGNQICKLFKDLSKSLVICQRVWHTKTYLANSLTTEQKYLTSEKVSGKKNGKHKVVGKQIAKWKSVWQIENNLPNSMTRPNYLSQTV